MIYLYGNVKFKLGVVIGKQEQTSELLESHLKAHENFETMLKHIDKNLELIRNMR